MLSHAVKLCLKPIEKIQEYEEYDSYTQIYSPDIESELLGNYSVIDDLLDLFLEVSGQRFFPSLTIQKFSKITKLFKGLGNRIINKFDVDQCFKKMSEYHDQIDFYAFIDAISYLLEKCFEAPPSRNQKGRS